MKWYRTYSSHRKCSGKKGILRNFAKSTGKHLCQRMFLNKVAGLSPATLLKKNLWHRCFPVNFVKFLRTPSIHKTSGRLPLVWERGSEGLVSVLDAQSSILKNWIYAMPVIMLSQTLIYYWQEIFLLTLTLRALVNQTIERALNLNVTWLVLFLLWFCSFSHARCGCCSTVFLRFEVVQIKKVDCQMSTKLVNSYK